MTGAAPFCAVARLTALEAIRRPVFLLVTLSSIGGILLLPLLLNYTLGDSARIIRDSAVAFYFVGGLILAAMAAGETLTRELRRGTAATILAKPVSRSAFFLAKAAGLSRSRRPARPRGSRAWARRGWRGTHPPGWDRRRPRRRSTGRRAR